MPFGNSVTAEAEQSRQPGFATQPPDQRRMETEGAAHAAHNDGYLPSCQRGYSSDDQRYLPSTENASPCDEPARFKGALVARQKRPKSYSAVQVDIGKRIKWARELVEPNRAAFARVLGVDRSTVQKIEDGDRAPSIFNVLDMAHRLRVTPDYILTGTLRGVEGELAGLLAAEHPELVYNDTGTDDGTYPLPKKPKRA